MKANLRRTLLALTVVGMFGAAQAYATDNHSVKISKNVALNSSMSISGDADVDGQINVNAAAVSVANGTQRSLLNGVSNDGNVVNGANITGNVGTGVSGNLGVNQAAGAMNAQGNQAAITAAGSSANDAGFTFDGDRDAPAGSMADAETFATQSSTLTRSFNHGTTKSASASGHAFENASGNVGVTQAAGDGNEQLNQLSAATAQNVAYAVATSTLDQEWSGNFVDNDPGKLGWCSEPQNTSNSASLSGHVLAGASGNLGLNQAAGTGNMQSNSLAMGVSNP